MHVVREVERCRSARQVYHLAARAQGVDAVLEDLRLQRRQQIRLGIVAPTG